MVMEQEVEPDCPHELTSIKPLLVLRLILYEVMLEPFLIGAAHLS